MAFGAVTQAADECLADTPTSHSRHADAECSCPCTAQDSHRAATCLLLWGRPDPQCLLDSSTNCLLLTCMMHEPGLEPKKHKACVKPSPAQSYCLAVRWLCPFSNLLTSLPLCPWRPGSAQAKSGCLPGSAPG